VIKSCQPKPDRCSLCTLPLQLPVEDADIAHARRPRSESTIESGNFSDYTAGYHEGYNPIYQSQWDGEFRQHSYSPWPIRIFAAVGAAYNVYMAAKWGGFNQNNMFAPRVLGSIFLSLHCEHRSYVGVVSCTLTGHVQFVGGAVSLLFLAVFCVTSMRLFCIRYYDHLCAAWATSMFIVETVSVSLHWWGLIDWLTCAGLCLQQRASDPHVTN
jgi:hypothetical protein